MILLDNQAVVQSLGYIKPWPAQHILNYAHELANRVATPSKQQKAGLRVSWISGHDEVIGNERADMEAKRVAKGDSSQASDLPALLATDPLLHSVTMSMFQGFPTGPMEKKMDGLTMVCTNGSHRQHPSDQELLQGHNRLHKGSD